MNTEINLQPVDTRFEVINYNDGSMCTICEKKLNLVIFGNTIEMDGEGVATCAKGDIYNESFGKALSWIRASKDIGNKVENYLIKYSCSKQHHNKPVKDLEVTLKLNTKEFYTQLKKLKNTMSNISLALSQEENGGK
jgi:hypothetical protein